MPEHSSVLAPAPTHSVRAASSGRRTVRSSRVTAPDPRSGRQVTAGRIIAPSARIDSVAFVDLAETRLIVAQHPSQADVS